MTTNRIKTTIKGKYRIRQYYTADNLWKETKTLIKKRKRNPFVIGSDARQWRDLFGLKKWLMK